MGLFRGKKVRAEVTGLSEEAVDQLAAAMKEDDPETIYMEEAVRDAQHVLFPEPEELDARVPLITRLAGKNPDMRAITRARVVLAIRKAIDTNEPIEWDQLDVVNDLLGLSVSLGGKGRHEAVELGRRTQPPEPRKKSLRSLLKG